MTILKLGDQAPLFTTPECNLANYKGQVVVLYFYPKDDTPGCTIEAREFAANKEVFDKLNAVVFGVSKDSSKSHDKFKEKYCLNFALISDSDSSICQSYGTLVNKSMFGKSYLGIERSTFLIDKEGRIAYIWNNVKVNDHALEVIDKIKQLNL